jgi:hypothetical protein
LPELAAGAVIASLGHDRLGALAVTGVAVWQVFRVVRSRGRLAA